MKGFETRSWATAYRGPLLIHAAKRFTRDQRAWCSEDYLWEALWPVYHNGRGGLDLPTGAIIGRVELVACHPAERARALIDEYNEAMGDYRDGRYAWEIVQPELFPQPIPYRGQQGFFSVPASALASALCQ